MYWHTKALLFTTNYISLSWRARHLMLTSVRVIIRLLTKLFFLFFLVNPWLPVACRLGVLTMDIHSPRANTWTLEQHPAFDRFTNQPTTFAVRPRHQPCSSSLSIILYPLNVQKRSFSFGDESSIGFRAISRRRTTNARYIIYNIYSYNI